jgi:hypothetical protein
MAVTVETPSDVARAIAEPRQRFQDAVNPERAAASRAAALANFEPGGPWAYAPQSEKVKKAREWDEQHEQTIGEHMFEMEQAARACEVIIEGWEAEGRKPPDPFTAWQRDKGQYGVLPPIEVQNLSILRELQLARFRDEFGDALPSAVLAAYTDALTRPLEQASVNFVAWVEARHSKHWTGVEPEARNAVAEGMQKLALNKAIKAAREARIPADVKEARKLITEIYAECDRAKTAKIRPRRPVLVKAS